MLDWKKFLHMINLHKLDLINKINENLYLQQNSTGVERSAHVLKGYELSYQMNELALIMTIINNCMIEEDNCHVYIHSLQMLSRTRETVV